MYGCLNILNRNNKFHTQTPYSKSNGSPTIKLIKHNQTSLLCLSPPDN